MVPRQHFSGGQQNLLGISKRWDTYRGRFVFYVESPGLGMVQKKSFLGKTGAEILAPKWAKFDLKMLI